MNSTFIKRTIGVTLMHCTITVKTPNLKSKLCYIFKVYYRLKALLNRRVFNPDLQMSTVLLLYREEGIPFQRSAAALLNAIPPKVTLFTQ